MYSLGKGQAALSKGHRNHLCSCIWNILAKVWLGDITRQVHEACSTQQLYSLSILGNTTA